MLNTQDLVNYLNAQLNALGAENEEPYTFDLYAEVENNVGADVNGIVRTVSADFVPVNGYIEGKYAFAVDLLVPAATTNYHVLQVSGIVDKLIVQKNASQETFGDGQGILTFTAGAPGEYQISYGRGEIVPLSFTVKVTYTENAVSSGNIHWFIDGVEIPYLTETVSVERDGVSRNIFSEDYKKVFITGQAKYYSFRVPYKSNFSLWLERIMHEENGGGNLNEVYTLSYYDGKAYTRQNPFTAKVKLFKTASSSSSEPEGSYFELTFADAYDSAASPAYYLGLIDFPFDNQSEDTRFFASQTEQQAYFEAKVNAGIANYIRIDAPNLNSLSVTSQVYTIPSANKDYLFDYANKNYAVVKVQYSSASLYFYYFVTKIEIGAGNQLLLDLQLDTVQTYFFDASVSFADCMIERAHLNRFKEVNSASVTFVTDPLSKIYNAEEGLNFPKRLVSRERLNFVYTGFENVDNWLNTYVDYWVYVYLMDEIEYTVTSLDGSKDTVKTPLALAPIINLPKGFVSESGCICFPIYKNQDSFSNYKPDHAIYFRVNGIEFCICYDAFEGFKGSNYNWAEELLANMSYFYNIKVSMVPPFGKDVLSAIAYMSVSNGNLYINAYQSANANVAPLSYSEGKYVVAFRNAETSGLFFGAKQSDTSLSTKDYTVPDNQSTFGFLKSEIKSATRPQVKYNPKLLGSNFQELIISASDGETFSYDIQKMQNTHVISFLYTEILQPEITKYYMRLKAPCGLYLEGTDENYTGLVGSTDNSLAFATTKYAEFLANNKNFWMQSNLKIGSALAGSAIGIGASVATGNAAGAATGALSAGVNLATSLIDRSMTVDNMKSAPDQMKNANGNVIFNSYVTDMGLYVEHYKALDGDLETANDFMNLYGFTYNATGNVRDFVNIRKYHNYIKAQLQGINGSISNAARADLRQRFANGIRFWNSDDINYDYENYENWLDD